MKPLLPVRIIFIVIEVVDVALFVQCSREMIWYLFGL